MNPLFEDAFDYVNGCYSRDEFIAEMQLLAAEALKQAATCLHNDGVGYRFKLKHSVERFRHVIGSVGSTGTVFLVDYLGVSAKMDDPIDGTESWIREIHWETITEFLADTQFHAEE